MHCIVSVSTLTREVLENTSLRSREFPRAQTDKIKPYARLFVSLNVKYFMYYMIFLPDPRGAGLHEAFQISSVRPYVRTYVRPYVSTLDFSFILHPQFTSDPQYFYRFRTSYVLTIRGADPKFPRPP